MTHQNHMWIMLSTSIFDHSKKLNLYLNLKFDFANLNSKNVYNTVSMGSALRCVTLLLNQQL